MYKRRQILALCWFVLVLGGVAFAGDCAYPEDCQATTGYLTTISVLGGLTALGAGLFLQPQPGTSAWDILHPPAPASPAQDLGAAQLTTGPMLTDRPWPGASPPPPAPSTVSDALQTQPETVSPGETAANGTMTGSTSPSTEAPSPAPTTGTTAPEQPNVGAALDETTIRAADIYNELVSFATTPYGNLPEAINELGETVGKALTDEITTAREAGGAIWGAGTSFLDQYFDPEHPFQTNFWKSVDAISSAEGNLLVGANPAIGLADNALNFLGDTGLIPKGFSISGIINPGIEAISTVGEGLSTGDAAAMNLFHQQSLDGKYGWIFQAAAQAGDYWMDNGFLTGLAKGGIDTGAEAISGILYPGGWGGATP